MRKTWTAATILIGVVFMIIGYFGAAPWGASSVANSNPRFSFAPALFVAGVVIAFSAALVYELLPGRREK
ncbi:MAG: hypothetical protein V3R84_02470 [Acidimicrobiia bacterium]